MLPLVRQILRMRFSMFEGDSGPSTVYPVSKTQWGFLSIDRMSRCTACNHENDNTTHDRCRTHADCARGPYYFAGFCGICHSLWDRSRNYEVDMPDAVEAFDLLFVWVMGFGKNSKGRPKGQDFFQDPEERREFVRLRKILKPRKRSESVNSSQSSIPSQRVSI